MSGKAITAEQALELARDLLDHHCGMCPSGDVRKVAGWVVRLLDTDRDDIEAVTVQLFEDDGRPFEGVTADGLRAIAARCLRIADEADAKERT